MRIFRTTANKQITFKSSKTNGMYFVNGKWIHKDNVIHHLATGYLKDEEAAWILRQQ
tara:strand:- start:279 stop:449 length:171 start_codon:yes stop_codon:yes gene_type:complete